MLDWGQVRNVTEEAARLAGRRLMELLGQVNPREKAPADLVSEADFAAQELIWGHLREAFPEFGFIGEEVSENYDSEDWQALSDGKPTWIVDPLDGTMNYLHQLPGFAVSIGLAIDNQPAYGVIFDPQLNEMFSGGSAAGDANGQIQLNGKAKQTSDCTDIGRSLIAASLPTRVTRESIEVRRFIEVASRCRSLRRTGSAALNLAYVACGRMDGYWATTVNAWDVSAGLALIEAAGGTITGSLGGPLQLAEADFTAAGTPELHSQLIDCLQRCEPVG